MKDSFINKNFGRMYARKDANMTTKFLAMRYSAHSIVHTATFFSKGHEYEINLQLVSHNNVNDSSLIFPNNYQFSQRGCWEVSFDLVDNIVRRTPFEPPPSGMINPHQVMRIVERAIFDHYTEFKSGMYCYCPESVMLERVYNATIDRKLGNGFTLERGLGPNRRGYVLRTPHCYS